MDWTRLPLSRAAVDRAAHRRTDPDLAAGLRGDPRTRVVLVADGRLAVRPDGGLRLWSWAELASAAGAVEGALELYLGEEPDGTGYLAVVTDSPEAWASLDPTARGAVAAPLDEGAATTSGDPGTWASLRDVGHGLDDREAGLAATAVGLAAWHERHPRCPRCGAPTVPATGGWTRRCTADGSDHYPRTDPAVIMAVTDEDDRLLLGHAAHWPERRFSTLAGYVEPGESAEAAVRREVLEEVGVQVGDVSYRGSQPWPFPASLMLAYVARAVTTDLQVDGAEVTEARWFTRAELEAAVQGEQVLLPMRTSVARALIEDWFGGPLGGAWG